MSEGGVSVKITKEWLEEKEACVEGIEWFCSQKETDAVKLIKKLIRRGDKDSLAWANWSIVRVMTYKQYVSYAVYAVELVIDVYEEDYPDDDRPRKAIEAAKKCINEPTKENKEAARAAAWESKGEWAARAARDAALAAWEVEEKWTAWAAGMAAKAAGKETLLKILKHGLRLLKE